MLLDHHLTDKADPGMLWRNLELKYSYTTEKITLTNNPTMEIKQV